METSRIVEHIDTLPPYRIFGRVTGVQGLLVEVAGIERHLSVGSRCNVIARDHGFRPLLRRG